MKQCKKRAAFMLALVIMTCCTSVAFASDVPTAPVEPEFTDELIETGARGNFPPGANDTKSLPYSSHADIANSVYTNYCVQPASSSLKIEFTGAVNGDTPGQCAIRLELYNATRGTYVTSRNLSKSTTFNLSDTITGLLPGNSYYVKVLVQQKTADSVRVNFTLWLRNT